MRSTAKLTYEGAQRSIDDGTAGEVLLAAQGDRRAADPPRRPARWRVAAAARAGDRHPGSALDAWSSAGCCRSSSGTPRSRCSPASARPRSWSTPGSASCAPCRRRTRATYSACTAPRRPWASSGRREQLYPDFIRGLDPTDPGTRPWSWPARACSAAAATSPSTARCPPSRSTPRWSRSTPTSPRRCAAWCDRYAGEVCVALCAEQPVPDWVLAALPGPAEDDAAVRRPRPRPTRTPSSTWSRPALLAHRVGEEFDAVVVASTRRTRPAAWRC